MEHETTIDQKNKKIISIVVLVYFNELNLPDTIPQLLALADGLPNYELGLLFVNDGSKDWGKSISDLSGHTRFIGLLDHPLPSYCKA